MSQRTARDDFSLMQAKIDELQAPPDASAMEIVRIIRFRVNQGRDWTLNYTEAAHVIAQAKRKARAAALEEFLTVMRRYADNDDVGCPEMIAELRALATKAGDKA